MRICRTYTAFCLIALTACLPLMGATGATISPVSGVVSVNGRAVSGSGSAMAGDVITTDANGTARMNFDGSAITAASRTSFQLGANSLRLTTGLVRITGGLNVAVKTVTVVPASATSQFEVANMDNLTYVHAMTGNVAMTAAGKTVTVHAGETAKFDDRKPAPAAGGGGGGISTGLAIGMVVGSAILTGIIVHEATVCTNSTVTCSNIVSPAVP